MDQATAIYMQQRPRLLGIAYRMLGALSEAEDVVQDVWMQWSTTAQIENPEAWLVAVTTRRSIDRLRSASAARESYVGMWLPEPIIIDDPATPEQVHERRDSLSIAFLTVLECLKPEARAAFLLHDVFDVDYAEIGRIVEKSEAACRQLVHRAREQLQARRARYTIPVEVHHRLLERFADAVTRADLKAMTSLLHESAVLMGDGGGIVISMPRPTVGGERIARALFAPNLRYRQELRVELVSINGHFGLLRYLQGRLESAQSYDTDHEQLTRAFVQRNPLKLASIAAHRRVALI
jgi:RNA polymerase sigma-70 factor (ECF subfamily)